MMHKNLQGKERTSMSLKTQICFALGHEIAKDINAPRDHLIDNAFALVYDDYKDILTAKEVKESINITIDELGIYDADTTKETTQDLD